MAIPKMIPNATTVDRETLLDMLLKVKGTTFASIKTRTLVRMSKKAIASCPFGQIAKESTVSVTLGFHYAKSVNRQRDREGLEADFVAEPRAWGERISGTPIVKHNGEFYLECKVERSIGHQYYDETGNPLSDDDVDAYLPDRGASRQGVEREIVIRDYKLDSIRSITLNGTVYAVRSEVREAVAV